MLSHRSPWCEKRPKGCKRWITIDPISSATLRRSSDGISAPESSILDLHIDKVETGHWYVHTRSAVSAVSVVMQHAVTTQCQ